MHKSVWRERIETIIVVTIITALVWLYAEGESVRTYHESIRVKFVAAPGHNFRIDPNMRTDTQGDVDVQLTYRASAGQHQEFRQKTSHAAVRIPITQAGEHAIAIKDELINNSQISQLGLNIEQANPATVTLNVQRLAKVTLPVKVRYSGMHLAKPATADPKQVTLILPSKMANQAKGSYVIALLPESAGRNLAEGTHTQKVKVTLPYYLRWLSSQIQVKPGNVQVSFVIANKTRSITLYRVPIRISVAPWALENYNITLIGSNIISDGVALLGPEDKINAIRNGKTAIWAVIRPTRDQLKAGSHTVDLHIHKPDNIKVISSLPQVKIKVSLKQ